MTAQTTAQTRAAQRALLEGGFGVATGAAAAQRPRRLSDSTRALAARYLSGEIGRTMTKADFALDPALAADPSVTLNRRYAAAARLIAERAPLRVIPDELLAGAATLPEALGHVMPLTEFRSISHTTLGFERALEIGYVGLRRLVRESLAALDGGGLDDGALAAPGSASVAALPATDTASRRDLLETMLACLDAAAVWHGRYVAELERLLAAETDAARREHLRGVLEALRPVPEQPPRTFRQGLQALWLLWDFQRLCGNWSGIGRIDLLLGDLLRRDLASGELTLDEARDLVAHFWIKGCEWIGAGCWASGDAQFYQNIVLAGVDARGEPVANELTELVLDVVEELHISDFPIAVRIGPHTSEALLRRVAAIQRLGGGIIAVYNEDICIKALRNFGYSLAEARGFANDGCWELLIPGKTAFGYQPFDALLLLQETLGLSRTVGPGKVVKIECDEGTLRSGGEACEAEANFESFEALYADFRARLAAAVDALKDMTPFMDTPCPLLSLLVEGCIERGRSYLAGGPVYTVRAPHAGGLPDVADSLLVLRTLVYEQGRFSLDQFIKILRGDWRGYEDLRRGIARQFDFYGNDSVAADAMLRRVYDDYTAIVAAERERHGVLRPAGISTFGRNGNDFLAHRTAAASGHCAGEVLANNFSPTPGADRRGPTAVLRSYCSVDYGRLPSGTALELKIHPASVRGETGLAALTALMRSFVSLGGIFMQIDVVDTELLRDAQTHPEKYPNLSVRISGWSARFATLDKRWQDMIIQRTEQLGSV